MKTKTKNIDISPGYLLPVDLVGMMEKEQLEMLRATNSWLIILFWDIGNELNQCLDKMKGNKYKISFLRVISNQLVANYGSCFTEMNLKKMRLFADQFPDFSNVGHIASVVSWKHILLLLQLKDLEARLFYARLTVEMGLSVTGLRQQMSAKLFEQPKDGKDSKYRGAHPAPRSGRTMTNDQKFFKIWLIGFEQQSNNISAIKNAFKKLLSSSIRKLMDPPYGNTQLSKSMNMPAVEEELIAASAQRIEELRNSRIRWFNISLNKSFWEIGKRINQEILLNKERFDRESIIRNVSLQLKKKQCEKYSEKQLNEMSMFAEQFSDYAIAHRIVYLVKWEHIVVLLSLQEIEAKLFYARLTAAKGLSVADLQNEIANHTYEQTSGAKEREQKMIVSIKNPVIKTTFKREGNSEITIMQGFVNYGDKD